MHLLRQRHLFALATYGLPPPCPSKPPRIPLPGPPAPTLSGSISGTLSGSLSGSRPRCGPSHSFNISAPHPGTFLHTSHARNSSNSGLCFQQLAHSFIFRILQVLCLPLLREPPGCIPTIPNLERISRRLQPHSLSAAPAELLTHAALPNRPRRPYQRSFAPSPAMSPPPIPGLNPVYEDYTRCIHCGLCLNACPTYR